MVNRHRGSFPTVFQIFLIFSCSDFFFIFYARFYVKTHDCRRVGLFAVKYLLNKYLKANACDTLAHSVAAALDHLQIQKNLC